MWRRHRLSPVPQSSPGALKVPLCVRRKEGKGLWGDSGWDSSSQGVTTELYEGSQHSAPPFPQEPSDLLRAAQGACEMDRTNGSVRGGVSCVPCHLLVEITVFLLSGQRPLCSSCPTWSFCYHFSHLFLPSLSFPFVFRTHALPACSKCLAPTTAAILFCPLSARDD